MSRGLGFPGTRRLRKRREFLAVQGEGRRISGKHFLFFVRRREPASSPPAVGVVAPESRFGITVTRKVGNAVTRNRIKRIVREGCRHALARMPAGLDVVVVAKQSAASVGARDTAGELGFLVERLGGAGGRGSKGPAA